MTTITIERDLLEQALDALDNSIDVVYEEYTDAVRRYANIPGRKAKLDGLAAMAKAHLDTYEAIRAALAAPDDIAAEMSTVADQYAHKLAIDLECVLADYSGTWYDTAIGTLGAYREAMNAIHERESPTFMGEPVLRDEPDKPADKPPTPAWHDAPEVATLKAELDAAMKDAERYRWLTTHARTTSEHWGGRWSIVIDGPAPERHGCKDALDEAIDAAIAKAEGRKE